MEAIVNLRKLGFVVRLVGDKVTFAWRGVGEQPKKAALPLLRAIRERKAEAVSFLSQEADTDKHMSFVKEAIKTFPGSELVSMSLSAMLGEPDSKTVGQWEACARKLKAHWNGRAWWSDDAYLDRQRYAYCNAAIRVLQAKSQSDTMAWGHIAHALTCEDKRTLAEYVKELADITGSA